MRTYTISFLDEARPEETYDADSFSRGYGMAFFRNEGSPSLPVCTMMYGNTMSGLGDPPALAPLACIVDNTATEGTYTYTFKRADGKPDIVILSDNPGLIDKMNDNYLMVYDTDGAMILWMQWRVLEKVTRTNTV